MKIWRALPLLGLFVFAVSGPVAAEESLLQQQDQGVSVTESAVPPASDSMSSSVATPTHAKKHHVASATHKAKKAKAHKVSAKKHVSKSKKHKI